jgi:hypothetical protein
MVAPSVPLVNQGERDIEAQAQQPQATDARESLRGSVVFYVRPFDPVGEEDWEVLSEP